LKDNKVSLESSAFGMRNDEMSRFQSEVHVHLTVSYRALIAVQQMLTSGRWYRNPSSPKPNIALIDTSIRHWYSPALTASDGMMCSTLRVSCLPRMPFPSFEESGPPVIAISR
jgi:hypothetical protein